MQRIKLLLVLTAALIISAPATSGAVDVPEGATVHFLGDSIFKGWGFHQYDYPSDLCRVQDICTLLLSENVESPVTINRVYREGENLGMTPWAVVTKLVGTGEIGPNDWVIYEDAADARLYRDYRTELDLIHNAAQGDGRTVIFMTMFDYAAGGATFNQYDRPTDDVPVKTINDAIRDAGVALGNEVIDMNAMMDGYRAYLTGNGWGSPVFYDDGGVHPNVYGNAMMAFRLLRTMGYDIDDWDITAVEDQFMHPSAGGDVSDMTLYPWQWPNDPTDAQRRVLVQTALTMSDLPAKPAVVSGYEVGYVTTGTANASQSVPEPSSTMLIICGMIALVVVSRRRARGMIR